MTGTTYTITEFENGVTLEVTNSGNDEEGKDWKEVTERKVFEFDEYDQKKYLESITHLCYTIFDHLKPMAYSRKHGRYEVDFVVTDKEAEEKEEIEKNAQATAMAIALNITSGEQIS